MKSKKKSVKPKEIEEKDLPATRAMLKEARDDLRRAIVSLDLKLDAKFEESRSHIESVRAGLQGEIGSVKNQLGTVRNQLQGQMVEFRDQLQGQIIEVRDQLQHQMVEFRDQLQGQIMEVRDQLQHQIVESRDQLQRQITDLQSQVSDLKASFSGMQSQMHGLHAAILEVRSEVEKGNSERHQMLFYFEEQAANNRVLFEHLNGLFQRQDRVEKRVDGVDDWVRSISKAGPKPGQS